MQRTLTSEQFNNIEAALAEITNIAEAYITLSLLAAESGDEKNHVILSLYPARDALDQALKIYLTQISDILLGPSPAAAARAATPPTKLAA